MQETFNLTERASTAIGLGESHFREFKTALEGEPGKKRGRDVKVVAQEVAEALVAFANADGGELLIGVEDSGVVTGIEHFAEEKLALLLDAPRSRVHRDTPLSSVRAVRLGIGEHDVLYFSVPKSCTHVHVTSQGHCMQRRDLESVPADPQAIIFERAEQASREYDRQFIDGATCASLDAGLVEAVANQISPGMSIERCLQYLDLAEYVGPGLRLRRGALLLFALEPQKWHPRLQIRIMKVAGQKLLTGDSYNVVSDESVVGNILQLINEGWDSLRPHLVQTRLGEDARFEATVMYPELACREALVNAIAHRDYSDEGRGIEIFVFDDRLEIRSPGSLLSSIRVEDLLKLEGVHQSRNAFVARVLRELGYMRELGEGLRRIFELMQKSELSPPELLNGETSFSVALHHKTVYSQDEKLWLERFEACGLNREQKAVVVMGQNGAVIAPQDIWDKLGIVDTEHYRQLVLSLQELGILGSTISKSKAQNRARSRRIPVRRIPRFTIQVPETAGVRSATSAKVKGSRSAQKRPSTRVAKDMVKDAPNPVAKLYLGNVPVHASDDELLEFLSDYGSISDLNRPGFSEGFAT